MESKDPNDCKASPDFLLKIVSIWVYRPFSLTNRCSLLGVRGERILFDESGPAATRLRFVRFARTSEIRSSHSAYAAYSEEFYGFTNSYIGGTVLLGDMANLIEETRIDSAPGKDSR